MDAPGETWHAFKDALQIIMCLATIAFIWQNLGVRIHIFSGDLGVNEVLAQLGRDGKGWEICRIHI